MIDPYFSGSKIPWILDHVDGAPAPSSAGIYLVPALVGLGAPCWCSDERGAMFGLSRGIRKEHVVRAALESMAYQSRNVLAAIEADAGIPLKELRADVGAIANDFMAQFQSDMLGVRCCGPGWPRPRRWVRRIWPVRRSISVRVACRSPNCGRWIGVFNPQWTTLPARVYRGWQDAVNATIGFRVG